METGTNKCFNVAGVLNGFISSVLPTCLIPFCLVTGKQLTSCCFFFVLFFLLSLVLKFSAFLTHFFYIHRFYLFLCSVCNNGNKEKLMRLSQEMTVEDIAHLALYSLTLETGKKYHDLDKSILPFLEKTWRNFEPTNKVVSHTCTLFLIFYCELVNLSQILSMAPIALRKKIVSTFWQNKNRYFNFLFLLV